MISSAPAAAGPFHNKPRPVENFNEVLRYSVPEAAFLLRQSVPKTWVDIRDHKLAVIREGGRTFIPGVEITRRCRLSQDTTNQTAA